MPGEAGERAYGQAGRRAGGRVDAALTALRRVLGMPDYGAYCRHLQQRHPERPLPSEREFFDQFLRARYGDGPTRCC